MIRSHRCPPGTTPAACWLCRVGAPLVPGAKAKTVPAKATVKARPLCVHLGGRAEFAPGCAGNCRHDCDEGRPAVPNGYCRTCELYEPRG